MHDQNALSAASRSFRRSFVAKIRVVTVTCDEDLTLVNYGWPLLSMVTLQTDCYLVSPPLNRCLACVAVIGKVTTQLLASILLLCFNALKHKPGFCEFNSRIFMLRHLHTSASQAWASSAAQQLAHHLTAKRPELSSFSLTRLKLPALAVTVIAQLAKGSWPSLTHMPLSQCALTAQMCLPLESR